MQAGQVTCVEVETEEKEDELPVAGQRYYRPAGSGTTAQRYYRATQHRYYRTDASPRSFGAKYVQARYYRPRLSGTTACQERYYRVCRKSSTLRCLLLYPFVAKTINRTPFPTF